MTNEVELLRSIRRLAKKAIPEDCYFIDPKRPQRTAAQFLDWLAARHGLPAMLSREAMHAQIFNFLDEAAWWKTSIGGPERGVRDHLIMPFCPSQRDVNRVAAALRQSF
jgi:hypothetical protein